MALLNPLVDDTAANVVRTQLQGGTRDWFGVFFKLCLIFCLGFSLVILAVLLGDVAADGMPVLTDRGSDFLTSTLGSRAATSGVAQGLYGTFWIAVFVLVLAVPIGVGAAVYLEEYSNRGRIASFIELNIRNLAGVPSVVFGLLGLTIFVKSMRDFTGGSSVVSAGLTLAVLVLPVIIITSAEAIRAVPRILREGAYGVGATKWQVIRTQVLPYAAPGIFTGTLLSVARAVGEAAPLILVGAATGFLTKSPAVTDVSALRDDFTAMPTLITSWVGKPQSDFHDNSAAAIIVLLVFVLALNSIAVLMRHRFENRRN